MHIFSSLLVSLYSFILLGSNSFLKMKEKGNRYFVQEVKSLTICCVKR